MESEGPREQALQTMFQYQDGTRRVVWMLVIALMAVVIIASPFGISNAVGEKSREIIRRVASPWWGFFSSGWNVPVEEEVATVVLFFRHSPDPARAERTPEWPPRIERQSEVYRQILSACPAVMVTDLIYDTARGDEFSRMLEAMETAARHCAFPPAIVFADAYSAKAGAELLLPLEEFVASRQAAARSWTSADANGRKPLDVGFGVVEDLGQEIRARSRYRGIDNPEYYRPYISIGSEAGDGAAEDRESLALAAYLAWCRRSSSSGCPSEVTDRAVADGERVAVLQTLFARPMDIQWRRWSPSANGMFWYDTGNSASFLGSTRCILNTGATLMQRIGESVRLFAASLFSDSLYVGLDSTLTCWPVVTLGEDDLEYLDGGGGAGEGDPSFEDHIRRNPSVGVRGLLSERVVFVGAHQGMNVDTVVSPIHGVMPGVFRHAVAFDNLARMGAGYFSLPETNVFAPSPVVVGYDKIVEIFLTIFLTLLATCVRRSWFLTRPWEIARDRVDHARNYGIRMDWRSFAFCAGAQVLSAMVIMMITFTASFAVLGFGMVMLGWSSANWIGVSLLSFIPVPPLGRPRTRRTT